MPRIWRFVDNTTKNELECDDLGFLLHTLKDANNLDIPQQVGVDLLLKGVTSCSVSDSDGRIHDISIGEVVSLGVMYKPKREIILN
jgi:hypothetical protein